MKEVDRSVARSLNDLHKERNEAINRNRGKPVIYNPGDEVYYRRPEGSGNKLDSRWLGPALILRREGEASYVIQLREGVKVSAHQTFLKPSFNKRFLGHPVPLYYHRRTVLDPEAQEEEWIVDRILKHRTREGKLEFLVKWVGYEVEAATWEPVAHFFHRYNSDVLRYCQGKGLSLNVTKFL